MQRSLAYNPCQVNAGLAFRFQISIHCLFRKKHANESNKACPKKNLECKFIGKSGIYTMNPAHTIQNVPYKRLENNPSKEA